MSGEQEDALYLNMLKQMGLEPEVVPKDMKDSIYQKLGLKAPSKLAAAKRLKSKKQEAEQRVIADHAENDILKVLGGTEQLGMHEVLTALDSANTEQAAGLNVNKLRSQIKGLNKNKEGMMKLDGPVSGIKRMRQEQETNYAINQKKIGKYIAQVKQGREQV